MFIFLCVSVYQTSRSVSMKGVNKFLCMCMSSACTCLSLWGVSIFVFLCICDPINVYMCLYLYLHHTYIWIQCIFLRAYVSVNVFVCILRYFWEFYIHNHIEGAHLSLVHADSQAMNPISPTPPLIISPSPCNVAWRWRTSSQWILNFGSTIMLEWLLKPSRTDASTTGREVNEGSRWFTRQLP